MARFCETLAGMELGAGAEDSAITD
jgi:hypothetical protein